MNKKKVSMKDIAQKAGVSTALVSYVLNGKEKESRVGPDIAAKVRQIASELSYQPNYLAKSLRSGKTQTIGLIIADISNPFFANIARIVEDEAKKHGYTVIIGSSDEDADKSWDLINVLLNRQVDGFIIVSSESSEDQIEYLNSKNVSFVLLDRHFPQIPTDFVVLDNRKASFEAGTHLIESGYRNIGMIAYRSQLFHMRERIQGYLDSLQANRVTFRPEWLTEVEFNRIESEIRAGIDAMLASDNTVDALIFATYRLAISGLKYINELGLKVPDDLAIVSFGQAEAFDLYYCPITYLQQPMEDLGKAAVELLVSKLKDPQAEPRQIRMEARLIARNSSKIKAAVS
ncbi:LacI family DNA-binding transcriptional regulator [Spirosoma taeanense]|uniref:LacI family DNA-binding transcriptional regulator n=1 Tax=Spirosoma taeanense TaxID=2735870 RepID=A0A6M5YC79_9BACT|nr:LacI family DNA-binding transcriptional regulator [Spirosoma taeanense]QJW90893.1 LacI family DNA-binding transcriptional regulator [Spirosoma taeanense]